MRKITNKNVCIKWILLVLFVIVTIVTSWCSDDAYHAYIMAKNLVDGNGFVYNVGERLSATTCPLFTLCVALLYALLGCMDIYLVGTIVGVLFSSVAIYILLFKVCDSTKESMFSVGILLGCYCFMTYTTAGLENSLLFFLVALFVVMFNKEDLFNEKDLFILALVLSLLAMTRMDSVLLFIPAICVGYLFFSKIAFWKRVLIGIAGLMPFCIWEAFSLIYYGYLFPNTMYVKLNTGFPKVDYYERGLDYLFRSSLVDILLLILPIIFFVLSFVKKNRRMQMIACGVVLYIVYVVNVGGDFMVGRHLTVPFFVSLIGINILFKNGDKSIYKGFSLCTVLIGCMALELAWSGCIRPIAKDFLYDVTWDASITGVADEKGYYYKGTGLIPYIQAKMKGEDLLVSFSQGSIDYFNQFRDEGDFFDVEYGLAGMANYYVQESGTVYLTDYFGLMDPLLSHLPAEREEDWRIGHMMREVPDGYEESVGMGLNLIENESLHEYYDKILLITRGKIWDKERLKVIAKMNLGEYDYLIEEYLKSLELNETLLSNDTTPKYFYGYGKLYVDSKEDEYKTMGYQLPNGLLCCDNGIWMGDELELEINIHQPLDADIQISTYGYAISNETLVEVYVNNQYIGNLQKEDSTVNTTVRKIVISKECFNENETQYIQFKAEPIELERNGEIIPISFFMNDLELRTLEQK